MVIAVVIGRRMSRGFPGKNMRKIMGRPLAYYPIKAAADCADIDRIYVSTDDERLKRLAAANGASVIKRPASLCADKALGEDAYLHAYDYIKKSRKGRNLEMMALLMCNAPMITSSTLSNGIRALRKNPEYDSAVTVSRYNMWSPLRARRIDKEGLLKPFVAFDEVGDAGRLNCDRDSQGDVWFADMGVSIVRPRCLENIKEGLLPQRWMGKKIYPLKQCGGLDVDYEWQIPQAEYWLKANSGFKTKE